MTGLEGFVFYFVTSALVSLLLLLLKMDFHASKYFTSWSNVWMEGLFQGLMVTF